jgi:hypothetical protein
MIIFYYLKNRKVILGSWWIKLLDSLKGNNCFLFLHLLGGTTCSPLPPPAFYLLLTNLRDKILLFKNRKNNSGFPLDKADTFRN